MGFIERLRQQQETETLARSQREAELSRKRGVEEATRQQREAQRKVFHEERRKEADAFRQESGLGELIEELAKILKKGERADCSYTRPGSNHTNGYSRRDESISLSDPDSLRDQVSWDFWDGQKVFLGGGTVRAGCTSIITETNPDGTIIVYGGFGKSAVPLSRWRDNRNELENEIEKAFKNPLHLSETYRPSPPMNPMRSAGNG